MTLWPSFTSCSVVKCPRKPVPPSTNTSPIEADTSSCIRYLRHHTDSRARLCGSHVRTCTYYIILLLTWRATQCSAVDIWKAAKSTGPPCVALYMSVEAVESFELLLTIAGKSCSGLGTKRLSTSVPKPSSRPTMDFLTQQWRQNHQSQSTGKWTEKAHSEAMAKHVAGQRLIVYACMWSIMKQEMIFLGFNEHEMYMTVYGYEWCIRDVAEYERQSCCRKRVPWSRCIGVFEQLA